MTKGFTLIELMVSIAIIGVVFGIVITSSGAIQKSSRDTQRQANLKTIQAALEQYHADEGFYPVTGGVTFGSEFKGFTAPQKIYNSSLPIDPINKVVGSVSYKYTYGAFPSDCNNTDGNYCVQYCLYANLENPPNPVIVNSQCTFGPNYPVNQP